MKNKAKIKVLIIDDSKVFREAASRGISEDPHIDVIGFAGDPFEARDKILELNPDVLMLDIELPKMDGITFLRKLMPQYPVATVVVSAFENHIFDALEAGAVEFVRKPQGGGAEKIHTFIQELVVKIKIASIANVNVFMNRKDSLDSAANQSSKKEKIIVVGASTGGTEAFFSILKELPPNMPGIVVVQHMPESFTAMYAQRLNKTCRMEVKEGADGDYVRSGRVIIAPGGYHLKLEKEKGKYRINCFYDEKVNGHRPSVDVLFHSAAKAAGADAIGVILTGMGSDGAKGLTEMRSRGSYTIGQDKETSVVFGMPKVAYDLGGVVEQLPLASIAQKLYTIAHL